MEMTPAGGLPIEQLNKLQQKAADKAKEAAKANEQIAGLRAGVSVVVDETQIMKMGIQALKLLAEKIMADIMSGKVTFKTGEGAATVLVSALKLQVELSKQVSGDGSNLDGEDQQAELAELAEAFGKLVQFPDRKGHGNKRKGKA